MGMQRGGRYSSGCQRAPVHPGGCKAGGPAPADVVNWMRTACHRHHACRFAGLQCSPQCSPQCRCQELSKQGAGRLAQRDGRLNENAQQGTW